MRFRATSALLLFLAVCACGAANETPTSAASEPRLTSPTPSETVGPGFATYSRDRITFAYPRSWRLVTYGSTNQFVGIYSPDYKDDGGVEIRTIQRGAIIDFSQTDLPQLDVTADNYASNPILFPSAKGTSDARVVVINGHNAFHYKAQMPPWWDSTETIFFRDDGTRVMVGISYPSGRDDPYAQDYDRLLESVVVQ